MVLSGYGLNCEDETKFAFELAGSAADIVHINDLIASPAKLKRYQIMAVPGGFSFGDDTGSGKAFANKLRNHLDEQLRKFLESDRLVIGICNGFQILTNLGILPGALTNNDSVRYHVRWVDLKVAESGPWLSGMKMLSLPVAHGEGRYYLPPRELKKLKKQKQVALRYTKGEIARWQNLPANPNGALDNIAGVTAFGGRVLGLMPHPERAISFTHLPHWTYLKELYSREGKALPRFGPGFQIFKNARKYFN